MTTRYIPTVHFGSILEVPAAVVVNPANSFLRHGGGLAAFLDARASVRSPTYDTLPSDAQTEQQRLILKYISHRQAGHRVPTGDAILGPPGLLPFAAIIHAVGPIWKDGSLYEAELLYHAYFNASVVARDAGYTSIVFPAIGAGIFGCPIEIVAAEAVQASYGFRSVLQTTYAVTDPAHEAAFNEQIQRVYRD